MPKHHVIVSGTGRAGTTFLMQLFTELGLDTGFRSTQEDVDLHCHAGMECNLRESNAPYIVKDPWLCDSLDKILKEGDRVIDHALVPVRDLFAAAQSRRQVVQRSDGTHPPHTIPGGLWHTDDPSKQEDILARQLYTLIHTIAQHDIPVTLLHFPRLALDPEYLFQKVHCVFPALKKEAVYHAFALTSKPSLIHSFPSPAMKMRTHVHHQSYT